ncbi:MAG: methylmalonyl Co-A mutase-associated GTPase MeaB [Elusimicrobia bacterium]|nr:methylmalonyl Co-A mutase-associated GTPase MeaB [Elusimicrobiota bacterium]
MRPQGRKAAATSATARRVLAGEVRAAAGLMRDLDDGVPGAAAVLRELYGRCGRAHVVGITGPPGSGKSTLADRLIESARGSGRSVGVVAVDPTSPISGGAVLGDRVRMQRHATDERVFIRSLASRGSLGGLSRSVFDTVTVLDAMGKDLILLETAGVGQDGVKVAGAAHTVLVVLSPGGGDGVQAIKAGVLEIGDIYVVNKCDQAGHEQVVRDLGLALEGRPRRDGWAPAVVRTSARAGEGIAELVDAVARHRQALGRSGGWEKRAAAMARGAFMEILEAGLRERVERMIGRKKPWGKLLSDLACRRTDPYAAARRALKELLG